MKSKVFDMQKLSPIATTILSTHIGYRNTELFDGTDHTAQEAYRYEIEELGNNNIPCFINVYYGVNITSELEFEKWLHSQKQFGTNTELFLYWFTSYNDVFELYNNEDADQPIQRFTLPDDALIVCDLNNDGLAIVSATPLSELNQTNVKDAE